jgi:hypothetical protein
MIFLYIYISPPSMLAGRAHTPRGPRRSRGWAEPKNMAAEMGKKLGFFFHFHFSPTIVFTGTQGLLSRLLSDQFYPLALAIDFVGHATKAAWHVLEADHGVGDQPGQKLGESKNSGRHPIYLPDGACAYCLWGDFVFQRRFGDVTRPTWLVGAGSDSMAFKDLTAHRQWCNWVRDGTPRTCALASTFDLVSMRAA